MPHARDPGRRVSLLVGVGLLALPGCRAPAGSGAAPPTRTVAPQPLPRELGLADGGALAEPDPRRLKSDMKYRRDAAWRSLLRMIQPVPAAGAGTVPLFQTWLDVPDVFAVLSLLPHGAEVPPDAQIDAAIAAVTAAKLAAPPPRAAFVVRHKTLANPRKGPGVLRAGQTLFSPAFIRHFVQNRRPVAACSPERILAVPGRLEPPSAANFAACFAREFPADAVMLKLTWYADDEPTMAYFDTDPATIRLATGASHWPVAGLVSPAQLAADDIVTVASADGTRFRLAALHIASKTVRDWSWVTLWWAKTPAGDYGEDRPAALGQVAKAWAHYKMCTIVDFVEADPAPEAAYRGTMPGLAATLATVHERFGADTWCANPYIEYEFTASSCVGCHQHGGLYQKPDLKQVRTSFPTDYTFVLGAFRSEILRADPELAQQTGTGL